MSKNAGESQADDYVVLTAGPTLGDAASTATAALSSVKKTVAGPESEGRRWRRIFDSNAVEVNGERYLNREAFVKAIVPASGDGHKIEEAQYGVLFTVADQSKRGMVSWDDFVVFQTLLKRPDADYLIAFKFFDVDGSGSIDLNEFKNVFAATLGADALPFNFDCDWVKLHLGKRDGTHVLGYNEFTQLMKGLQDERLRQAFKYLDSNQDGFITPDQFKRIILELEGHKLSDSVLERLPTLCALSPGGKISYAEVVAFHNVIKSMDMVERVIREATAKSKDGRISQDDFLNYSARATRYGLFSPMEASIIFHFAGRGDGRQRLALLDFAQLLDPRWQPPMEIQKPATTAKSILETVGESMFNFCLGGIAGAFGATIVYPIDLDKVSITWKYYLVLTFHLRMQNQRSTVVGQLLYKNSLDCVRKVFRNEGLLGFYRGLGPQLVGVAPEKAIKLTVNDFVRSRTSDPETGRIKLGWEIVAGGTAGGCQVIFTNPLEIVKIRLQVQGELGGVKRGAGHIIKELGLLGLYKGASACLLRDIPFSAIYFTAYAHLKKDVFHEGHNNKKLSFGETLAAAGIAGMPAAYLTTPADVVKTRLQVEARKGETNYKGIVDAFKKIFREEGFRALYKGGPARVIRSSPQFAGTLLAFETLQSSFPYPWAEQPKKIDTALTRAISGDEDLANIRSRNALKILLDVHGDIGRRPQ
ncbi:probable mitochondrial carrier protein ARALAR1 [Serendipita indica DSM 11827]|uniref:Mitochondrial aspartate-glutamate transporter AGC1 n=1 Tax=Serendipita indica (strain DSM 11827) TaxID=1109443 RepID=G4T767_SERID|nr:probable mitochondrial carrier protein ARALAR1 [Serendipita indica DSM 11827]